jgi:hypothetical protein
MPKTISPYNITKKQKDYADNLIETGSPVESAMRSYDCGSREMARVLAFRNSKNEKIQAYIDAMLQLNDTVGKSVRVLDEALDANIMHKGEETALPDHQTRLKASKQTLTLVTPKESAPKELHLEKHEHTHFAFGDDIPEPVLKFIVKNQGRWPSEVEFKRLTK